MTLVLTEVGNGQCITSLPNVYFTQTTALELRYFRFTIYYFKSKIVNRNFLLHADAVYGRITFWALQIDNIVFNNLISISFDKDFLAFITIRIFSSLAGYVTFIDIA